MIILFKPGDSLATLAVIAGIFLLVDGILEVSARSYAAPPTGGLNAPAPPLIAHSEYQEVVETVEFAKTRLGRPNPSTDRTGTFKRGAPDTSYSKSPYTQDWFASSSERTVANLLDAAAGVRFWVRLQRNDLPILWSQGGREYNPDFIAVETDGTHWVVEVKQDREMQIADVQGKREASRRWANHVNADASASETWQYLLVSETDVRTAHGAWSAH